MYAINDPIFWMLIIELFVIGMIFIHTDMLLNIVNRIILSLRIGLSFTLFFISGGIYHTVITVEKDGEVIEEYRIG